MSRNLPMVVPQDDRGEIAANLRVLFSDYLHPPFPEATDLLVVWAFTTHAFELFEAFPQLALSGAKGSGKSRCLDLLRATCARPRHFVGATPASLFRLIDVHKPTLLVDEAEVFRSRTGELGQVFKSGYRRGAAVPRFNVRTGEIDEFGTYCPKAIASTEPFDDVVADRAFLLAMKRSRRGVRDTGTSGFQLWAADLQKKASELAASAEAELREELDRERGRSGLIGRQRELWLPMLAVGRFLGGECLRRRIDRARIHLAVERKAREMDENPDVGLLVALESLFEEYAPILDRQGRRTDWYPSDTVLAHVNRKSDVRRKKKGLTQALRRLGVIDEGLGDRVQKRLNAGETQIDVKGRQVLCYRLTIERVAQVLEVQLDEVA